MRAFPAQGFVTRSSSAVSLFVVASKFGVDLFGLFLRAVTAYWPWNFLNLNGRRGSGFFHAMQNRAVEPAVAEGSDGV
jgi:hypothetical protein